MYFKWIQVLTGFSDLAEVSRKSFHNGSNFRELPLNRKTLISLAQDGDHMVKFRLHRPQVTAIERVSGYFIVPWVQEFLKLVALSD